MRLCTIFSAKPRSSSLKGMVTMKTIKVNNKFSLINIKGMALLEFIIVVLAVFVVVAIFIEAGYYMKAEASVIGFTRVASREVAVTGGLSQNSAQMYANKLNAEGIRNIQINLFDLSTGGNTPVTIYNRTQSPSGMISNETYTNSLSGGTMGFRRNFKLVIKGEHPLNAANLSGSNFVNVTVIFGVDGKVEKFKFE